MSAENNELETRIERLEAKITRQQAVRTAKVAGLTAVGALAAGLMLWPTEAASQAAACSVPNCFTSGEPAVAADVNENFAHLAGLVGTADVTSFHAEGTDTFALTGDNAFHDMADLSITFTLERPTAVLATYNITAQLPDTHLVTQLHVDGAVVDISITGNTVYVDNDATYVGQLAAGEHTIKVSYRTPATGVNHSPSVAWQERQLNVHVFGAAQ